MFTNDSIMVNKLTLNKNVVVSYDVLQNIIRHGHQYNFLISYSHCPEMVSLVKRNNCGKSLEIARHARDMLGGIVT